MTPPFTQIEYLVAGPLLFLLGNFLWKYSQFIANQFTRRPDQTGEKFQSYEEYLKDKPELKKLANMYMPPRTNSFPFSLRENQALIKGVSALCFIFGTVFLLEFFGILN